MRKFIGVLCFVVFEVILYSIFYGAIFGVCYLVLNKFPVALWGIGGYCVVNTIINGISAGLKAYCKYCDKREIRKRY